MLDISLYSAGGKPPITIDVSESFYQWLIQSDFAEIGVARPHAIQLDDETVEPIAQIKKQKKICAIGVIPVQKLLISK